MIKKRNECSTTCTFGREQALTGKLIQRRKKCTFNLVALSNHTNLHFLLREMDFEENYLWDLELLHSIEALVLVTSSTHQIICGYNNYLWF